MLILFVMFLLYFSKPGISNGITDLWVLVPPIVLFLGAEVAFLNRRAVGWRRLLAPFSWAYILLYRSGLVIEFLSNRDLRFLFRKTVFSTYQLVDEWPTNVARQWTMMICYMLGWTLWIMIR
jgi:hypothetical protein